jgi:hypothetical protein
MTDSANPDARARELLHRLLPEPQWAQFAATGVFDIAGSRGIYQMSCREITRVLDSRTGQLLVTTCLQLSIPAPATDRLIAEYLLIVNDEDLYWRTANVFQTGTDNRSLMMFLVLLLDLLLFAVLIAEVTY